MNLTVPGILYSTLLGLAAYAVEYFTNGAGAANILAPVLIAAVPIVLKLITVTLHTPAPPPGAAARSIDGSPAVPSRTTRLILG